ncbi:hypothetical protein NLG97_g8935 [Lecanicillium saksenae]|uniref:Uncharacterized protein n=1 Tax=Lecanicillium saksenae TaxID=468837 RepID=A0ACC1QHN2_9HYPO|nr:hypothetical protein NLG97_g8935 [Lecanicillium saksenae]
MKLITVVCVLAASATALPPIPPEFWDFKDPGNRIYDLVIDRACEAEAQCINCIENCRKDKEWWKVPLCPYGCAEVCKEFGIENKFALV